LEVGIDEGWNEGRRILDSKKGQEKVGVVFMVMMRGEEETSAIARRDAEDLGRLVERGDGGGAERVR